jgi:uncharacterized protein YggL (DUF469 family)
MTAKQSEGKVEVQKTTPYDDEYDPDEDFDNDDSDCDNEDDELERAMDECGQMSDGFCTMIGSEYCDWECPFSRQMHNNLNRKRDAKGRFCK